MRHTHRNIRLHTAHRRADAYNLVRGLLEHEQIRTTLARAKVVVRLADRMITLGKQGSLAHRRQAARILGQGPVLRKVFTEIAKRYASRQGGFTRLMRDLPRVGDGSPMALVELIGRVPKPVATQKKQGKEKGKVQPAGKKELAAAAAK